MLGMCWHEPRTLEELTPVQQDALRLDETAARIARSCGVFELALGCTLSRLFRGDRPPETLGYRSFAEYCDERLGVCAGTVRQRIWLEGRMRDLPALREALLSGRLTYSKAVLVAKHATWADIDDRIARAAATTCQQTERETEAEEDRKNRGAGVRRLWAPSDAARTIWDAIGSAQARALGERKEVIDAGEALALIADHFAEIYEAHLPPNHAPRWFARFHRDALMRKGGLCAVPGCSRAARHVHHIVFRSHGGPDEAWNGVGLCVPHHLHGIHLGYLELAGRAGERLHWKFGAGEAVPLEEWVTLGDDDVRRADQVPRSPATSSGGRNVDEHGAEVVAEGYGDARGADRRWIVTCMA